MTSESRSSHSEILAALKPAIRGVVERVLDEHEVLLGTVEAVEVVPWRERVSLGGAWAFSHLVMLVVTENRLLELALRPKGTKLAGRVREIEWSNSARLHIEGQMLQLGDDFTWLLRQPLENEVVVEVARLAQSGAHAQRSRGIRAWRLCAECGLTATSDRPNCQRCGALSRSVGLAKALAWLFPGAGMLFINRPLFALLRLLVEGSCFGLLTWILMNADGAVESALVLAAGIPIFMLMKLESVAMTKSLANRAGTIDSSQAKRWRQRALAGLGITLIAGSIPFFLSGRLSKTITSDLAAEAQEIGWSFERSPDNWAPQAEMDSMRAQWRHMDGWLLGASAEPFLGMENVKKARQRWLSDPEGALLKPAEEIDLGNYSVIRRLESGPDPENGLRVRYVLIDDYGRDSHVLTVDIAETDLDSLHNRVRELIPCLYWTASAEVEAVLDDGSSSS